MRLDRNIDVDTGAHALGDHKKSPNDARHTRPRRAGMRSRRSVGSAARPNRTRSTADIYPPEKGKY